MARCAEANRQKALAAEEVWPYTRESATQACTWSAKGQCEPNCRSTGVTCTCHLTEEWCGREVDAEALARADGLPMARITTITALERDKASLMSALAKGQDVWMSMRCDPDAFDTDALLRGHDGLSFVLPHFDPEDATAGHALLIVGYRVQPSGTYFLFHNSWGEAWGDRGYAWIHETTLMRNLTSAYTVDAEPWDPSWSKVPPRQENPSQCTTGLLPDSITGQCTPPCPDGSARHNAACADPNDCPAGYVNLYGECVVAAPNTRGTDARTGINYACAAGGCSFVVPFGVYGCFLPWCTVSCPSPRFRLTSGPSGLSCTE
jgi:hypothetical protein